MEENKLHSEHIKAGKRTYFFDIKKTKDDKTYIVISESKRTGENTYERQKVMIFDKDIQKFSEAFIRTLINYKKDPELFDQHENEHEHLHEPEPEHQL